MTSTIPSTERAGIAIAAILAAIAAVAITQRGTLLSPPIEITPRTVFGVLVPLLVVVVALGYLVGSDQSIREGVTPTHVAIGAAWAVYLLAGLAFLVAGYTGWVVLAHLAVAIGAGVVAAVGISRSRDD